MKKAVLILSGGLDSTTLLYDMLNDGYEVFPITFYYGQRHGKEVTAAKKICQKLEIQCKVVDISSVSNILNNNSLTNVDINIPDGHYADDNMKSTVVPNRNMILLALAIGYAINLGLEEVYYGAHSGDHTIYPDCRPEFIKRMDDLAFLCHYYPIYIEAPYFKYTKGKIVEIGSALGVDYSLTWTCYNGREKPCGKCGSCIERLEAFAENIIDDPLEYEK